MKSTIFVVEGKTDKALLQSYSDNYIVITDGNNVSRETIKHLQQLEKHHSIVLITDPDHAGDAIKAKLQGALHSAKTITIPKTAMQSKKKIGVAESNRAVLMKKLAAYPQKTAAITTINYYDFWLFHQNKLRDTAKQIRFIADFALLNRSVKSLHRQLQYLGITIEDIRGWANK